MNFPLVNCGGMLVTSEKQNKNRSFNNCVVNCMQV